MDWLSGIFLGNRSSNPSRQRGHSWGSFLTGAPCPLRMSVLSPCGWHKEQYLSISSHFISTFVPEAVKAPGSSLLRSCDSGGDKGVSSPGESRAG